MIEGRTFQGLSIGVERVPIPNSNQVGARVILPDQSEIMVAPNDEYPTLDSRIARAVNDWRVDKWFESGHGGVI